MINHWLKPRNKIVFSVVVSIFVFVAFLMLTQSTPPVKQIDERAWPVVSQVITKGNYQPTVKLYGKTAVASTSNIVSTISADVLAVPAREGDLILKAQPLLQMDATDVKLALDQAKASVAEIQANIEQERINLTYDKNALTQEKSLLALSENRVQREKTLRRSKLASEASVDNAEENKARQAIAVNSREQRIALTAWRLAALEARLTDAKATLALRQRDFSRRNLLAPFDAKVVSIAVAAGTRIRPGDPLMSIFDVSALEVSAFVPLSLENVFRTALKDKQKIHATLKQASQQYTLSFDRLSGQLDDGAGAINALFAFASQAVTLSLNEPVTIFVTLPTVNDVIKIPMRAIFEGPSVYKIVNNRLKRVNIETVAEIQTPENALFVLAKSDALSAGDALLLTRLTNAATGLLVQDEVVPS